MEYCSVGIPVVATRLPELEPFEKYVYLANSSEDFAAAIKIAVQKGATSEERTARKEFAARFKWDSIVQDMESIIMDRMQKNKTG